jgi:hypothetical protein
MKRMNIKESFQKQEEFQKLEEERSICRYVSCGLYLTDKENQIFSQNNFHFKK